LRSVLKEFPKSEQIAWQRIDTPALKKLRSNALASFGRTTQLLLWQLNSSHFINFLEILTGITGLIPDLNYFNGGLHQAGKGCYFKVHTDFNWHPKLHLYHRLNFILYLNEDWQDDYGGHLELWNKDITKCKRKILPVFNRCVIFKSTDFTYHGYPEPLTCPRGETRKSIALYYYTAQRPAREISKDSDLAQFRARPGERIGATAKGIVKKVTPPILIDTRNYLKESIQKLTK